MTPVFAFLSPATIAVLGVVGVLLFGRRLPEIARYLGKGIVEFKKGMAGLEDNLENIVSTPSQPQQAIEQPRPPQRVATTAPKFQDSPASTNIQPPQAPPQV